MNDTRNVDALRSLLDGELTPCEYERALRPPVQWWEEDSGIRCNLTADGTTGPQWIDRLHGAGYIVGEPAQQLLRCDDFKPTRQTYEIFVIRGTADRRGRLITTPVPEVACLMREAFTDATLEQMGFERIIVMHPFIVLPLEASWPQYLRTTRMGGGRLLDAGYDHNHAVFDLASGFAYWLYRS